MLSCNTSLHITLHYTLQSNTGVRMNYLSSYSETVFIKVAAELENYTLMEEPEVRINILATISEKHKKDKEDKEKYYKEYLSNSVKRYIKDNR